MSCVSFVERILCGDPQVQSIGDIPEFPKAYFFFPFIKSCNCLFQNIMEVFSKVALVISCHVFFPKPTVFLFPE